jgi:hypothetical protein
MSDVKESVRIVWVPTLSQGAVFPRVNKNILKYLGLSRDVGQNHDRGCFQFSLQIKSGHRRCTLRKSLEPLKWFCFGNHTPLCVVLVAYSENNVSPGDRSATLHVLILRCLIQREHTPHPTPPAILSLSLSCRHLHFAYVMNCQLQNPQYGLFQLV